MKTDAQNLELVRRENIPSSLMVGLTDPFIIPYALALGATPFHVGVLSSLRNLILSLIQIKSADAIHWFGSRKKLILFMVAIQAALWIPLAFVKPMFGPWALLALILFYTCGMASGAFGGPAWGSLVSDYLSANERGRFFGQLSRVSNFWIIVSGFAAGATLHRFSSRPQLGFALLCLAAGLCRCYSWRLLAGLQEREISEPPHHRLSFLAFLIQGRRNNFVRFAFCLGAFNFAVNLAAPLLPVYMMKELHFNYLTYTTIILSGAMMGLLVVRSWGWAGDLFGNQSVLRWTILADSLLPFFWALFRHPVWIAGLQVMAGFIWAGLSLATVNFVYDSARPSGRARHLAYFNVINGLSISAGAFMGGGLLTILPPIRGNSFVTLFLISGILRAVAALFFRRLVWEVRPVRQVGLREVVYDFSHQQVVQVLGFFSVKPEQEFKRPRGLLRKIEAFIRRVLAHMK